MSDWRLSADGYGPVSIGMTPTQVAAALGHGLLGTLNPQACSQLQPVGVAGLVFLFEHGLLGRITVSAPSLARTRRGIRIGSNEMDVTRAYGYGLEISQAEYEDPPAKTITYWIVPGKRGLRFLTSTRRLVETIHVGDGTINYIEGCL